MAHPKIRGKAKASVGGGTSAAKHAHELLAHEEWLKVGGCALVDPSLSAARGVYMREREIGGGSPYACKCRR